VTARTDGEFWFACLGPEQAAEEWPRVEPLLRRAQETSEGELELVDVFDRIQNETMFLSVMGKGSQLVLACVVQVVNYHRFKVLEIVYVGGAYLGHFISSYFEVLTEFAHEVGCKALQCATSKPALERLFLRYRPRARVVYSVLREGVQE
jgi:hypothetical protein